MSALTKRGSTRRWRKIRRAVLVRDGYSCRVPVGERLCGAYATDAGHIVARSAGGSDDPANLRAECAHHNRSAGARMRTGRAARLVSAFRAEGW